ncbi:hypothetical protein TrRE_jg3438, partial [Triparma retinervis]
MRIPQSTDDKLNLQYLPAEVLDYIESYLDALTLTRLSLVSLPFLSRFPLLRWHSLLSPSLPP